ncbi:MAG: response regulator [Chloroflexota bacterium]
MSKGLAFVIEDDANLVELFSEALRRADYETESIQSGDIALNRLRAVAPSVVVLDLHLPKVSGMDILALLREDDRFADTRIIIASADATLAETLHDQADLVLVKPVSFHQLRDLARRL